MNTRHCNVRVVPLCLTLLVWLLAAPGCASDTAATIDAGDETLPQDLAAQEVAEDWAELEEVAPADETPPEFRDVRVEILSSPPVTVDLNSMDVERVLPMPVPAAVTVLLKDDTAAADQLKVDLLLDDVVLDAADVVPSFSNGLWTLKVPTLGPGQRLQVQAGDAAGNSSIWSFSLQIPTLEEAMAHQWQTPFYTAQGQLLTTWTATWNPDFTWEESRSDPDVTVSGWWQTDQGLLSVAETRSTPGDSNGDTIEFKRQGAFYVDETYFAHLPLQRIEPGSGMEGVWSTSWLTWEGTLAAEQPTQDVTWTIHLNADGSCLGKRTGLFPGDDDQTTTLEGTWQEVPNENYIDNYGNYLVVTFVQQDGVALATPVTQVDLAVIRNGLLLLSPKIRSY